MTGLTVDAVGEGAVVIALVLVGIAHTVPEEQGVQALGQDGKDQAPDAVVDEVLIDLCAGCEAATELGGKGYEGDTHDDRHLALVN